jgi:hypothetical protein
MGEHLIISWRRASCDNQWWMALTVPNSLLSSHFHCSTPRSCLPRCIRRFISLHPKRKVECRRSTEIEQNINKHDMGSSSS